MSRFPIWVLKGGLAVAARQHGGVLNRSDFSRRLQMSTQDVRDLLRAMVRLGWIRLLPAWAPDGASGCFRRPRIFLRSSPLLSVILRPKHRERAFGAALLEGIFRAERRIDRASRFFYFATYHRRSLDLIVERRGQRTGYLFLDAPFFHRKDQVPLKRAVACGAVRRAFLLYRGDRGCFAGRGIIAVPHAVFLARYEDFTVEQEKYEAWHLLLRWLSQAGVESPLEPPAPERPAAAPAAPAAPGLDIRAADSVYFGIPAGERSWPP